MSELLLHFYGERARVIALLACDVWTTEPCRCVKQASLRIFPSKAKREKRRG